MILFAKMMGIMQNIKKKKTGVAAPVFFNASYTLVSLHFHYTS